VNKFNVTNTPALYDETFIIKQNVQTSYASLVMGLGVVIFMPFFILMLIPSCKTRITKFVVSRDFTMVTGGERQTTVGGFAFMVYLMSNIFIILALLQEQLYLNEFIYSTQTAS
jgi:hypothetical protein